MSGAMPACSIANQRPVRPNPVWISSTISSAPRSRQTRSAARRKSGCAEVDAALALHDFENHRGGLIGDGRVERRRIVERHVRRLEQRLEAFPILRLPRHRQRARTCGRESPLSSRRTRGASVTSRANFSAPSTASAPLLQRNTCGRCVGSTLDERLRELRPHVVVEIVGAERERMRLPRDRLGDAWVAVAEHRHALGGPEIEIAAVRCCRSASSLRR